MSAIPVIKVEELGPYVTVKRMASATGYTPKAIQHKIDGGVWVEGREWVKAPDGRRLISIEGYKKWVAKETA